MSIAGAHNLWLSLIDVTGAFLSLPVLQRAFPNGLDVHEPEHFAQLKLAFAEWQANAEQRRPDVAIHRRFFEFVLHETLSLPPDLLLSGQAIPNSLRIEKREHSETLQPDFVLVTPAGREDAGTPRLLIQLLPLGQGAEKPLAGSRWAASPVTRMQELLLAAGFELGLITNGKQWTLVRSKRDETTSIISWETEIWFEEKITLQAFRSLLSLRRFFAVGPKDSLESLFTESKDNQQELTEKLGSQVRQAIEVLMRSFETIDKERDFLAGVSDREIYEAALTIMMRLVVLLCVEDAEEDLFGVKNSEVYQRFYSVTTLHGQLDETARQHGEEILERKFDAWARLMATFRAIHTGVNHDLFHLLAHGGDLFSPDKYPFLEGRDRYSDWKTNGVKPLPVDNRVIFHLLTSLQFIQERSAHGETEARRVSFRSLNVERIGNIYESLLDHTARRAPTDLIELDSKEQPIVSLDELEAVQAKGEDKLIEFLKEKTKRTPSALKKALASMDSLLAQNQHELGKLRTACHNNEELYQRALPFFGLIRRDTRGLPIVIVENSLYVASGQDRRSTGTHYTPPNFTFEVVKHTLEPLVYEGLADGKPVEEWRLLSPKEILDLKICDLACGSGAFLVQICRFLGEKLVESWDNIEAANAGKIIVAPDGTLSEAELTERLIPSEPKERLLTAKRYVADRCLYGVDRNPVAVEMAKISVWLETMQKGKPFSFLDHNLRTGDSLLGVTNLNQLEDFSLGEDNKQIRIIGMLVRPLLKDAVSKRRRLEDLPSDTPQQIELKEHYLRESQEAMEKVRFLADLLVGEALQNAGKKKKKYSTQGAAHAEAMHEEELEEAAEEHENLEALITDTLEEWQKDNWKENSQIDTLKIRAEDMLRFRKPFHWLLEFPEVFASEVVGQDDNPNSERSNIGFDAIVSNPPFMGGKRIMGSLGTDYRDYLVSYVAGSRTGSADLVAYFFLRASNLVTSQGFLGLLATNTISQGDTREVGLDQLTNTQPSGRPGSEIYRAISSRRWEGTAALEVAFVWIRIVGAWNAERLLNGKSVRGITSLLTIESRVSGKPYRLKANAQKSFIGTYLWGKGFVVTPELANELIGRDERNREVLFPYLNGEDLNTRHDQMPTRWVINFADFPLRRSSPDEWSALTEEAKKKSQAQGIVHPNYTGEVAMDFPDCYQIVLETVKPVRDKVNRDVYRQRWWQFAERCQNLYDSSAGLTNVLITARVSPTGAVIFDKPDKIYNEKVVVFPSDSFALMSLMQSSLHWEWARHYTSTLGATTLNYSPTDCFETFPFADSSEHLESVGMEYHEYRQRIMSSRQEGLTQIYNRVNSEFESSPDIARLRELQAEMDLAVRNGYGWDDLSLDHGFHETKQGVRFTISPDARQEVLDRLLELNHERYAEEVVQGLHEKGGKKKAAAKKPKKQPQPQKGSGSQPAFGFMPEQDDLF